ILQKARHHPATRRSKGSDGLQAHGFRYSFTPLPGYFSSFPHGTRPLSVTRKYLGLPSGPGRFTAPSTETLLLENTTKTMPHSFRVRDSHPLRPRIPTCSTNHAHHPQECQSLAGGSHNPTHATPDSLTRMWFSLLRFRSPLLTESLVFSLPTGTEMFHFPAFPPHALYIQARVTPHHGCRVSPFGHPRITARLATPRGLSQPPTSFIGP